MLLICIPLHSDFIFFSSPQSLPLLSFSLPLLTLPSFLTSPLLSLLSQTLSFPLFPPPLPLSLFILYCGFSLRDLKVTSFNCHQLTLTCTKGHFPHKFYKQSHTHNYEVVVYSLLHGCLGCLGKFCAGCSFASFRSLSLSPLPVLTASKPPYKYMPHTCILQVQVSPVASLDLYYMFLLSPGTNHTRTCATGTGCEPV